MRGASAAGSLALSIAVCATVAQLAAVLHEAGTRHVRCSEHGELTHVTALVDALPLAAANDDAADRSDAGEAAAHEHCAVTFTVRGFAHAPMVRTAVPFAPPPAVTRAVPRPPSRPGRALVLASAPKTSPPRLRLPLLLPLAA